MNSFVRFATIRSRHIFVTRITMKQHISSSIPKRCSSTATPTTVPKPPVPDCYLHHTFRSDYLSDPSTYPLIGVLGFSALLIIGMSANTLINDNHDLRVFPEHKQDVLRTWGDEKVYDKLTRKLALGPIIMHEKDYRSIWQEGLGVNHEEWLKQKQQVASMSVASK